MSKNKSNFVRLNSTDQVYLVRPKSTNQEYLTALENVLYDFWHYRYHIHSARTPKGMRKYLNAVQAYKAPYSIPARIKSYLRELKKRVMEMYMHDCTRREFDHDLKKMVEMLTEAIREENPSWEIPENYARWPEE